MPLLCFAILFCYQLLDRLLCFVISAVIVNVVKMLKLQKVDFGEWLKQEKGKWSGFGGCEMENQILEVGGEAERGEVFSWSVFWFEFWFLILDWSCLGSFIQCSKLFQETAEPCREQLWSSTERRLKLNFIWIKDIFEIQNCKDDFCHHDFWHSSM
jgi:hypothetical protein